MAEENGTQLFCHAVVVHLCAFDDTIHFGLILGKEEIDIRRARIMLNTNDTLLFQILEDILSIVAKLELVLVNIGHQKGDDIVNGRREDLLVRSG